MKTNPELVIFSGPMFSGKTTRLLSALDRFKYQNKNVIAFKPKLDDRYSIMDIKTHNGYGIPARSISNGVELRAILFPMVLSDDESIRPDVVAVDEVFMIDGSADVLIEAFRSGVTVMVSSLEMSAACNVFKEVNQLMPWATRIEKCPAVCTQCSQDAYYTHRKIDNPSDAIQVGGSNMYEPRCWSCHNYVSNAKKLAD